MRTRTKIGILGAGLAGLICLSESALLRLERKPIYVSAPLGVSHESAPSIFMESELEKIAQGEDIIPGMPETGAMCSKFIRAEVNSLLGASFFKHHRLHAKIGANLRGVKTLPADQYGVRGDAWEMYYHIQEAGGKIVYETDSPVEDFNGSTSFLQQKARIGDIIGFYYPDSKFNPIAKAAGAGFTHMGIVVGMSKTLDGKRDPVIAHLIHTDPYYPEVPALRYETVNGLSTNLTFRGYLKGLDFQKDTQEYKYRQGDPLIFPKVVLRPSYGTDTSN